MRRHALFVGVNHYDDPDIRDLDYAIPDASVLADRFRRLGYKALQLSDPAQGELKKALIDSVKGLGQGDVFLFFFAGHGFTAQDGSHLLFCRDDFQKLLRDNSAGIRVNAIETLTEGLGGFNRAFLLDSCRTDCFAGVNHRGGGSVRDLDIVSMPEYTTMSGSFFLLRSCDKFQPSLEFKDLGHGLFTQGLLNALDARDGRLAGCDTSFAVAVGAKMADIQSYYKVDIHRQQRPSVGECSGPVFSLFDKSYLGPTAQVVQQPITPYAAIANDTDGSKRLAEENFQKGLDFSNSENGTKAHPGHKINCESETSGDGDAFLNELKQAAANGDKQAQLYLQERERSIRQDIIWGKIRGILDYWPGFVVLAAFLVCLFWLLYVRSLVD